MPRSSLLPLALLLLLPSLSSQDVAEELHYFKYCRKNGDPQSAVPPPSELTNFFLGKNVNRSTIIHTKHGLIFHTNIENGKTTNRGSRGYARQMKTFNCMERQAEPLSRYVLVSGVCMILDCSYEFTPARRGMSRSECRDDVTIDFSDVAFGTNVELAMTRTPDGNITSPLCSDRYYDIVRKYNNSGDPSELSPTDLFTEWDTCMDSVAMEGDEVRMVNGQCTRFDSLWPAMWRVSQPMCFVALVLLVLSLTALATLPHLRSSIHGRALACHAAALLLFNLLQAVSRYMHVYYFSSNGFRFDLRYRCIAYLAHFSLQAANFWLTVVCINMAIGFRRLQRAPAAGKGNTLKRFAVFSGVGWGMPLLSTALTATVLEMAIKGTLRENKLYLPTLSETRICFPKLEIAENNNVLDGSFFYYYLPCVILLLADMGLFAYIALKIRTLKKETVMARAAEDLSGGAWLYIRLLLSTGVLEAIAEITFWARPRKPEYQFTNWLELLYRYEAPLNLLDVARALFVFWATCCTARSRRQLAQWGRSALLDLVPSWRREGGKPTSGPPRLQIGKHTSTTALPTPSTYISRQFE